MYENGKTIVQCDECVSTRISALSSSDAQITIVYPLPIGYVCEALENIFQRINSKADNDAFLSSIHSFTLFFAFQFKPDANEMHFFHSFTLKLNTNFLYCQPRMK